MDLKEAVAYLKTWARLNAQEVYGSPREYLHIESLNAELNSIERAAEKERGY